MSEFAQLLAARKIANIEECLNSLLIENRFPYIPNNDNGESILQAIAAWCRLAEALSQFTFTNSTEVSTLNNTCLGSAVTEITTRLKQHIEWLEKIFETTQSIIKFLTEATIRYHTLRCSMTTPSTFDLIDRKIARLNKTQVYKIHTQEIVLLQNKYLEYEAANIKIITIYYQETTKEIEKLPQFSEFRLPSRIKRANQ